MLWRAVLLPQRGDLRTSIHTSENATEGQRNPGLGPKSSHMAVQMEERVLSLLACSSRLQAEAAGLAVRGKGYFTVLQRDTFGQLRNNTVHMRHSGYVYTARKNPWLACVAPLKLLGLALPVRLFHCCVWAPAGIQTLGCPHLAGSYGQGSSLSPDVYTAMKQPQEPESASTGCLVAA